MTRQRGAAVIAADKVTEERPPKCLCCGGAISGLSDEDVSVGLDLSLGLVSDESALICNACTARLIEARASQAQAPRERR